MSLLFGARPSRPRRLGMAALLLFVLAVHGCVTQQVLSRMADSAAAQAMPPRIEVAYVRDMALSTPPPTAAPAAPPAPVRARAARPARAASAPPVIVADTAPPMPPTPTDATMAAAADTDAGDVGESLSLPREPGAVAAAVSASTSPTAALPASASASSALAAFEWPASTRISYALTGNYRGEVSGTAQVEWIRAGADYQVHLDLVVGPGFAPLITRRMSSDGAITAAGLAPRRYDEDTRVMLRDRNRISLRFEPGSVVLANGERRDTVPGVQDTASQFVQLTYVFSTRPELLRVGGTVDIPLALKNKVDVWTYDVVGEEILATTFGPLPTLHLTPQRPPRPGDLSAEIWFAPQLRYLPVRIRIRQDAQTYIDLLISKRPELGQ